jgi:hypothetical protein
MVKNEIELNLALGDFSYNSTADCWLNLIAPIENKTAIAIGNHEDSTLAKLNEYMSYFNLTRQFYSFDYQNIHFIAMSTEYPFKRSSIQYVFVKNDLAKAVSNAKIDWIVVYFHTPAYFSACRLCVDLATPIMLRNTYHPLFDQYGVDLVLQGHIHNYQRSYPLKYSQSNSSPIITDTHRYEYIDPEGEIYAVIGTGGHSFNSILGQAPYIVYQQNKYFGYLNVDVLNDGKTLSAKFYANDGSILDQFIISKTNASASPLSTAKYEYEPYLALLGSNYEDIMNRPSLQLSKFSVGAWFNTNMNFTSTTFIVNKGGTGVDNSGANMNYGIWMTDSEKIGAGFENLNGTNFFVTSPNTYADGKWHYAVVTYDGSTTVKLFVDGVQVSSTLTFGARPDNTGIQPVRVGANSLFLKGYFTGSIDEVRIWDRSLTTEEVVDVYKNGMFDADEQIVYLPFSHKMNLR